MPGSSAQIASSALRFARVAFTGKLATMTRREAGEIVRRAGGQVTTNVSRRTSMVVVGGQGWPVLRDGSVSRKLRRAETLNARGAHVEVVSEAVFREAAGLAPRPAEGRKQHSLDQVCDLLGLEPPVLRRWEALGLIRSSQGQYDFQDIVSLRAIAELTAAGVAPAAIAETVRGLARVLPDADRPLAQLKVVARSGRLLAELGDTLLAPDGQLVLNFDAPAAPGAPALRLADEIAGPPRTPGDWFELGRDLEEEERYESAVDAYRQALADTSLRVETHFNLGNALRAAGRLEAAQEHLLTAVALDPDLAAAWYNLADVQEELGDLDGAIASLRRAVAVCPTFADGHYNLALCCHDAGLLDEARQHWRIYLRLDADSPWADTARRMLGERHEGT